MALTTLDPNSALTIVDLQKGITGLPGIQPIAEVIAWVRGLADAFHERYLPVVLVTVAGGAPGRTEQNGIRSDAHDHSTRDVFPRPGETIATQASIDLLRISDA